MASVPADVGSPKRVTWHTVLRWFGVLCLMGAAYFAGYVAWLLWGTGIQTQQAQNGFQPTVAAVDRSTRSRCRRSGPRRGSSPATPTP